MSAHEQRPARTPPEPPRWEQRLRSALPWYCLVFLGSVLLATGVSPVLLPAALQPLAYIVVLAEFVAVEPVVFVLVVRAMRRNPAASRSWVWGTRLLVTGAFGGGMLLAYGFLHVLVGDWHRSTPEVVVLAVLGTLVMFLSGLGLALVIMDLIGELRHAVHARYRRPPARSRM